MRYKRIALVGMSNALQEKERSEMRALLDFLAAEGVEATMPDRLYAGEDAASRAACRGMGARERAAALARAFADERVEAIFDVSGGDLANEALPHLDYDFIRAHAKPFYGYSDVTAVCNALWTRAGVPCGLFQIRTTVRDESGAQRAWLSRWDGGTDLRASFLRGGRLEGICVGGNVRCFLKLAGTPYFPHLEGKVLALEALSGALPRQIAYLAQLRQLPGFDALRGILLGSFTEIEQKGQRALLEEEVLRASGDVPVAATRDIGHGSLCRCVMIGEEIHI